MSNAMSRRRMILASAAAAGATWFDIPRLLAGSLKESHQRYGGFGMGIQSYSLRHFDVDTAIAKIAELGLHYVEFFAGHYPPTTDVEKVRAMQQKLDKHQITCNCHGVQRFTADHEANEQFFRFARLIGVRNIAADFGPDAHDSLEKLVSKYRIRIAAHNHGPGHRWDKISDLQNQLRGLHPYVGVCADLGHFIRSGEDPAEAIYAFKERLYGIHLKDFEAPRGNAKGAVLGEGVMDLEPVFRALKHVQFPADGALSLEYEENPQDPMEELKKCLANAEEAAKKVA